MTGKRAGLANGDFVSHTKRSASVLDYLILHPSIVLGAIIHRLLVQT